MPRFTVPNLQAVPVGAGEYRLRLAAPGRLDETYRLTVERGARQHYKVGLERRSLWDPIRLDRGEFYDVMEFGGRRTSFC